VASSLSNLANVELASGNIEDASDYFDRSVKLWMEGGDATASNLALTYLNMARLQKLQGKLDIAMRTTMLSESLFARTMGTDKGFMAKYGDFFPVGNALN
jgi:tetratricopeptide (TPR) repeat protein